MASPTEFWGWTIVVSGRKFKYGVRARVYPESRESFFYSSEYFYWGILFSNARIKFIKSMAKSAPLVVTEKFWEIEREGGSLDPLVMPGKIGLCHTAIEFKGLGVDYRFLLELF